MATVRGNIPFKITGTSPNKIKICIGSGKGSTACVVGTTKNMQRSIGKALHKYARMNARYKGGKAFGRLRQKRRR